MARMKVGTRMIAATAIVLNGLMAASPALAAQRAALVIGNAAYAHVPALANPLNDAADVGAALARLGFAVTRLDNTGHAQLRQGLLDFQRAASASEVAVVFYAGHGIEVDGRNFLVPVDARLASDQDVEFEAIPLALVSRAVSRASGLRLVVLDACRENPFAVSMQRAGATRSIGRGLARVEPSGETLVAYAAKEGTVAADGEDRNSPYSAALLRHLEEPGLEVGLMFRRVRDVVLASTGGRQEPFVYGSLSSRGVYLAAAPTTVEPGGTVIAAATPSAADATGSHRIAAERLAVEREFWASVKDSADPSDVRAYLDRYPTGQYAVLARNRLKRMEGAEANTTGRTETSDPTPVAAAGSSAVASVAPSAPPVAGTESSPAPADLGPEESEASLGLERPERRLVQQGLASLGFSPGPPDGLFGRRTREAIRRYQGEKGFAETGYLSVDEAQALVAMGKESRQAETEPQAEEARRREAEARRERDRQAEEKRAEERRSDDEAFSEAKRLNTSASYRSYLERGGNHEAEARELLAEVSKPKWEVGKRFRDCAGCPELVVVPSGSYIMGSPSGEGGRTGNEGPLHRVTISEPFAVGVYEVTRGEWRRFVGATGHMTGDLCWVLEDAGWFKDGGWKERSGWSWRAPGFGQGDKHPVVCVSWEDAKAYVRWLSRETGLEYRLLSESEWEYVARGGSSTSRHWGDSESSQCRYANGADISAARQYDFSTHTASCDDGYVYTSPVGSFDANGFGLHDVAGNAAEWVEDCWHGSYAGAPADGSARVTGGDCGTRVLRGGSWGLPGILRSADRYSFTAGERHDSVGFRVARTLD